MLPEFGEKESVSRCISSKYSADGTLSIYRGSNTEPKTNMLWYRRSVVVESTLATE